MKNYTEWSSLSNDQLKTMNNYISHEAIEKLRLILQ
jgi:hypothetical protein